MKAWGGTKRFYFNFCEGVREGVSEYLRGTKNFHKLCKLFFISGGDENNNAVITKNDNSIMATDWYDINVIKLQTNTTVLWWGN